MVVSCHYKNGKITQMLNLKLSIIFYCRMKLNYISMKDFFGFVDEKFL